MNLKTRQQRAEGGAWILEQLSLSNPAHERNAARRAMNEVIRAWPGDTRPLWWKWFNEASHNLGLRSKTLDCTVAEAVQLASEEVQIVAYTDDPTPEWMAVFGTRRSKFVTAVASETPQTRICSRRVLRQTFERFAVDGQLRCVLIPPQHLTLSSDDSEAHMKPFDRLKRLLQPEWSDIWLVLIFAFVVGLLALATPIAVEALVNTVAFGRFLQPIVVLAAILLTFLGFAAALRALQTWVVEIIQRRLFARVAADLAFRLPRAHVESTDNIHVPELVNRFFDVVTVQKVSAGLLLEGIGLVLSTVIGMIVLGFYHPWLLGFDILLIGCIFFIVFVLGRGAVSSAIKESKNKYLMASWLEDIARCPSTFRNDGGTKFAMERADRLIHEYLKARRSHFHILVRQILFALGLQALASTLLLALGGWLVVSGELTLGQLVAAELIVTSIVGAFAKVGKHLESFYDLLAAVDKIGSLIDLPHEREDGMLTTAAVGQADVELHGVGYSIGEVSVLNNVSMGIEAGARVAVLGASGSGKSVLMDLLYGSRGASSGHILIDGFDPNDLRPDVLRNRVALVRGEIFNATIEDNVHLHREEVSAGDVRDALDHLGLVDTISRLEDGSQTILTSDGKPLTSNQIKLLSIARAVVGRPGLLLIDGILDGLPDGDIERVCRFLLDEKRPWTVVIATGQEAIASRCQVIMELNSSISAT